VLAYPIRLNDKLAGLASMMANADGKPTQAAHVVYADLARQIDAALAKVKDITAKQVPAFNQLVSEQKIPVIVVDEKGFLKQIQPVHQFGLVGAADGDDFLINDERVFFNVHDFV
jgi:hypothetical protein